MEKLEKKALEDSAQKLKDEEHEYSQFLFTSKRSLSEGALDF